MTAFVVVNPHAGNGRTRRDWGKIEEGLESIFPLLSVAVNGTISVLGEGRMTSGSAPSTGEARSVRSSSRSTTPMQQDRVEPMPLRRTGLDDMRDSL